MNTAIQCQLRILLLGPFKLEKASEELSTENWKSKKALTLFKFLVSKNGEKVPRDVLIELLWPDADPDESASHNLHTTVYFLRKALKPYLPVDEPSCIHYSNTLYWMDKGIHLWVDVDEFEALYSQGNEVLTSDNERALECFTQALALYRGDFLSEDLYDDWLVGPREHFRELFIDATLKASTLLVDCTQDYSTAVRLCREALARDPFREELYQAMISFLIKAGRYSEAAILYRQCAKMLEDEFGLSVSPETRALFHEMKRMGTADEAATSLESGQGDNNEGPFICDHRTFDSICKLEVRRQDREGDPLVTLTITNESLGASAQVRAALKGLSHLLRRGDVVAQKNDSQISVLLPHTGPDGLKVVVRRIERAFQDQGLRRMRVEWQIHNAVDRALHSTSS